MSGEQKASHRKRLRRRGAVCFVGAPLRCAEASPSSRLLASGPAALATPPHTLFQQPAEENAMPMDRREFLFRGVGVATVAAMVPRFAVAGARYFEESLGAGLAGRVLVVV